MNSWVVSHRVGMVSGYSVNERVQPVIPLADEIRMINAHSSHPYRICSRYPSSFGRRRNQYHRNIVRLVQHAFCITPISK